MGRQPLALVPPEINSLYRDRRPFEADGQKLPAGSDAYHLQLTFDMSGSASKRSLPEDCPLMEGSASCCLEMDIRGFGMFDKRCSIESLELRQDVVKVFN